MLRQLTGVCTCRAKSQTAAVIGEKLKIWLVSVSAWASTAQGVKRQFIENCIGSEWGIETKKNNYQNKHFQY